MKKAMKCAQKRIHSKAQQSAIGSSLLNRKKQKHTQKKNHIFSYSTRIDDNLIQPKNTDTRADFQNLMQQGTWAGLWSNFMIGAVYS